MILLGFLAKQESEEALFAKVVFWFVALGVVIILGIANHIRENNRWK